MRGYEELYQGAVVLSDGLSPSALEKSPGMMLISWTCTVVGCWENTKIMRIASNDQSASDTVKWI